MRMRSTVPRPQSASAGSRSSAGVLRRRAPGVLAAEGRPLLPLAARRAGDPGRRGGGLLLPVRARLRRTPGQLEPKPARRPPARPGRPPPVASAAPAPSPRRRCAPATPTPLRPAGSGHAASRDRASGHGATLPRPPPGGDARSLLRGGAFTGGGARVRVAGAGGRGTGTACRCSWRAPTRRSRRPWTACRRRSCSSCP